MVQHIEPTDDSVNNTSTLNPALDATYYGDLVSRCG